MKKDDVKQNEAKVRSIRATDETFEKFRAITEEFTNSNDALTSLIKTWEIQQARAVITDRDMDINDFNSHIQALQEAYLHSLELNENAEQRIKQEFELMLKSKDTTIQELQERAAVAETAQKDAESVKQDAEKELAAVKDKATADTKQMQTELEALQDKLQAAEQMNEQARANIIEKEQTLKLLYEKLADSGEKIKELESFRDDAAQARQNAETVKTELETVKKELADLKEKSKRDMKHAADQAQLEKEKAVLEAEKTAHNELEETRRQLREMEQENYKLSIQLTEHKNERNKKE